MGRLGERIVAATAIASALAMAMSGRALANELKKDATWNDIRDDGRSLVFGRIKGRFDGAQYRGRKLRVRNKQDGKEHEIRVDQGLGFFEAVLPVGTYSFVAIEAIYFPRTRPLDPKRFPPVPQKYRLRPLPDAGLPTFPVVADRPLYLGTIQSDSGGEGLVYEGHALQIVDDFSDALSRLEHRHGALTESLAREGIEPTRYFFLKPLEEPGPLDLVEFDDPLDRARDYIAEGKSEQALSWLQTFMPTSDAERSEVGVFGW